MKKIFKNEYLQAIQPFPIRKLNFKGEAKIQVETINLLKGLSQNGTLTSTFKHVCNEVPNTASQYWRESTRDLGRIRGTPDLCFVHAKLPAIEIEIKTDKGRLSPHQRVYQKWSENLGTSYVVMRSAQDILDYLYKKRFLATNPIGLSKIYHQYYMSGKATLPEIFT